MSAVASAWSVSSLMWRAMRLYFFFFFNDPATTEIYSLPLHDALPITSPEFACRGRDVKVLAAEGAVHRFAAGEGPGFAHRAGGLEHEERRAGARDDATVVSDVQAGEGAIGQSAAGVEGIIADGESVQALAVGDVEGVLVGGEGDGARGVEAGGQASKNPSVVIFVENQYRLQVVLRVDQRAGGAQGAL